jgi:Predicted transcriptional regulators
LGQPRKPARLLQCQSCHVPNIRISPYRVNNKITGLFKESVSMYSVKTYPIATDLSVWQTATVKTGEKVKVLRTRLGWSQSELARHAHLNKETVNRIELGAGARVSTLQKIADTLDRPVTSLMGDEEPRQSLSDTKKKTGSVTRPDLLAEVQESLHTRGGDPANAATRRLSEAEALRRLKLFKQIYDATDAIRAATDALRGGATPGNATGRKTSTERHEGHPDVHLRATRKRGARS